MHDAIHHGTKGRLSSLFRLGHSPEDHAMLPLSTADSRDTSPEKSSFSVITPKHLHASTPGRALRKWLHIDTQGRLSYIAVRSSGSTGPSPSYHTGALSHSFSAQADKHTLVTELDIPYRDLRILDPKARP